MTNDHRRRGPADEPIDRALTAIFAARLGDDSDLSQHDDPRIAELPLGAVELVVTRGPNVGFRYQLEAACTTAGRHPDSDVFLDDVTVSRRHAEFRRRGDEIEVIDTGSLNGTYVNRHLVATAPLTTGDEVQIGKFRLVLMSGTVRQPPPADC